MSLPPEQEASYIAIIDQILAESDLSTVSAKKIRKGLQAKVDYDIEPQKGAISDLIVSRYEKFQNAQSQQDAVPSIEKAPEPPATATNGVGKHSESATSSSPAKRAEPDDESELSSIADPSPPKKKQKKVSRTAEDDDAAFAAKLQAEENSRRQRSTRGGGATKKKTPVKKTPKKKSAKKVKDEDDSDLESGSDAEKKEVKRSGGFHKPMVLSQPLAELLGETTLSRPQTVKKIWEYVKARDLQDPNDKRQIRCDDLLRAVFKQDRVHMFTMNKILAQNLYAQDE